MTGPILATAALLAAIVAIAKFIWTLYKFTKRMETALQYVEAQMRPNGGESLMDKVNRIDTWIGEQGEEKEQ